MEHMTFTMLGITVVMDKFMDNLYKVAISNSRKLVQLEAVAFADPFDMEEIKRYVLKKIYQFV